MDFMNVKQCNCGKAHIFESEVIVGKGAEGMIVLEKTEQKYCPEKHRARLQIITHNWDKIKQILNEELPTYKYLENLFKRLGLPTSMKEIGMDVEILPMTFGATKDIRDKYVLSRLAWDLGITEELLENTRRIFS